jgi:hypothetical protein
MKATATVTKALKKNSVAKKSQSVKNAVSEKKRSNVTKKPKSAKESISQKARATRTIAPMEITNSVSIDSVSTRAVAVQQTRHMQGGKSYFELPSAGTIRTHSIRRAIDFTQEWRRCYSWKGGAEVAPRRLPIVALQRYDIGVWFHSHSFTSTYGQDPKVISSNTIRCAPGGELPVYAEGAAWLSTSILSRRYVCMQYMLHVESSYMSECYLARLVRSLKSNSPLVVLYDCGSVTSQVAIAIVGLDFSRGQAYFCPVDDQGVAKESEMYYINDTTARWSRRT